MGLNAVASGVAGNGLYAAMHPLLVGAVVCVALFVFLLGRLEPAQDIATHLPRALLYLTVTGAGLAVTTPASWSGPIATTAVLLAVCAALAAPDRASGLAALFGIGVFTVGVVGATEAVHAASTAGKFVLTGAAVGVALLGLFCLGYRHKLLGSAGITMDTLRTNPIVWARLSVLGIGGIVASIQWANHEHVLAAVLGVTAGASWVGVAVVFSFMERRDALVGILLTITGFSVIGLGWVAFSSREFVAGLICITTGAAMAGGGLWLLDSAGFIRWLKSQFKPQPPA